MWTIIKFDKKEIALLKKDFKEKLGKDFKIYSPKIATQKYTKNKLVKKEFDILGDYLFCYHKNFNKPEIINTLKFARGLKYFLDGFVESQDEIVKFINKCRNSEDKEGYLSKNFYELFVNCKYKFSSGPFAEMIFKIVGLQKNKIEILLGNLKTTIKREEFLYRPL